jgi:hypothetical protein
MKMTIEMLDAQTRSMIPAMVKKGYCYIVQIDIKEYHRPEKTPLGEPLFFKSASHVGPFLRGASFEMTVAWSLNLQAETPLG